MPRRSVRTRRRTTGFLSVLIALLALAAIGLVCAIIVNGRRQAASTDAVQASPSDSYVEASDLPETEVVLKADTYREEYLPAEDADPEEAEPSASPTPEPTPNNLDPAVALRPTPASENMLPVFKRAKTSEHVIAITLDECDNAAITEQFLQTAQKYGAKLTLFPNGDNLLKSGMQQVIQKCVFQLGYEVENRGFTGLAKLFQFPTGMMVQEIWKQSAALNYVLGVKYQPHFYRTYGGLGENDPRTHAYLKQEGYLGLAHWTELASNYTADQMEKQLKPGGIYLFRTTRDDGECMVAFMEAAQSSGYRMVTLNELFGFEDNTYERVQGSLLSETMPEFNYDETELYDILPGETSWAVLKMQERLGTLGYLTGGKADGIFGEATSEALRLFQATIGRAASGAGDVETLQRLFAEDAPRNAPAGDPTLDPKTLLVEEDLELSGPLPGEPTVVPTVEPVETLEPTPEGEE